MTDKKPYRDYVNQLIRKLSSTLFLVAGISVFYILSMIYIDHNRFPLTYLVLFLSISKTGIITYVSLQKVSKLISSCHTLNNMILTFSLLILITLISFATDYTCLFLTDGTVFSGIANATDSYLIIIYQFFYFSVITFSTVGYGDVYPVSNIAKFIVTLEIFLSFFIIVFSISSIKNIQINE